VNHSHSYGRIVSKVSAILAKQGIRHKSEMKRILTEFGLDGRELSHEPGYSGAPSYSRRLSDKILIAFDHACNQADYEVAKQLLLVLEKMLARRPSSSDGSRRRHMQSLVTAHERLWCLRHPETADT